MKKTFVRLISLLLLICMLASFVVPATFAEEETVLTYIFDDFSLVTDANGKSAVKASKDLEFHKTTFHDCGKAPRECLKECFYDTGVINWAVDDYSDSASVLFRGDHRSDKSLRLNNAGTWVSIRLNVTEAGKYDIALNSVMAYAGSEVWMFPASKLEGSSIAEQMNTENSLGTVSYTGYDAQLGEYAAAAGEHIIVFKNASNTRFHINKITLTKTGELEVAPTETTEAVTGTPVNYDFLVYKNDQITELSGADKNYSNTVAGMSMENYLAAFYPDTLKWKLEASSENIQPKHIYFRGVSNQGLRIASTAGDWVAFRVQVPQAGTYDLSIDAVYTRDYTADVYVLTADGEEMTATAIESAMTGSKVGSFALSTGNLSAQIGSKTFDTAGEYIIVLENTAAGSSYMYFSQINMTPSAGDAPEDTTAPEATTVPEQTTVPAVPTEGDYWNFKVADTAGCEDITATDNRDYNANCLCGQNHTAGAHLESYYSTLGWKIVAGSTEDLSTVSIRQNNGGIRFTPEANGWVALTLKVTETGLRDIYVTGSSTQGNINGYIFAGALTPEQIAEKMADKNAIAADLIATSITPSASGPVTIGAKDFTAGEYTFVLYCSRADKGRSIYLTGIGLKEYTGDPEGPTTPSTPSTPGDTDCAGTYTDNFFNFALATEEARHPMFNKGAGLADRDYTSACYACGKTVKDCLAKHWADGNLNWVLEGTSFAEMRIQITGGVRMRYDTDENGAKIPTVDKNGKDTFQESVGNWVAYRVKVATPGTFTITANKTFAYGWIGEMYIIPAPAAAMTASELTAAMTESNKAGAVEFTATMTASEVGEHTFDAAGEYIIMIKATGSKRMYLDSISLTVPVEDEPIPAVDTKVYDFNLMKDDPALEKKGPTSRYNADGSIRTNEHIESLYNNNTIDWKFETQSTKWQASTASFRAGCFRFKSTTNYRDVADRQWFAFRIENPGTDTYDIRLTTSQAGMMVANIYLIPAASPMTLTAAKVEAAMTQENMLVKGALFDKMDTFYLGEYTFGIEEEYVIVFELTKGTQLFLNEIKMTKDGVLSDGTVQKDIVYNGFVYDFDMNDSLNGYFSGSKSYIPDVYSELNAMWRNGTLKWKWESSSSGEAPTTLHRFYRVGGMRLYHKQDAWVAVRIKSPGSGTFTLTMNHAIQTKGGTCAVYILPGDTEDIEFAMDPKNRVGKVAMYNDGISTAVEDGKTSFVGYWDFEAGKEYIMVFESYKQSPYDTNSYVNISQVIAQKGKIEYTTTEDKKVDSVVVAENVVPVADALSTCVVADIYGHDYFFLPIEGGAMLVYDMDTGELVDTVTTGYSRSLDMRQDQDGNIWISGSSKYIVRYNPYSKETFRTPAFTAPTVEGFSNYSGANSICPTSDGKLWFSTYYSSVLGVYDPETNTYRKVGKVTDQNVSKIHSLIEYDGFLYMTTEADGAVTSIVKFDMATEQVVGSVDTSHLMGTSEYINTLSMLGDGDLLVGGTMSGKLGAFVAVNPETMELVEVEGIFGYMNAYASEEIDGKHYIVSGGYGLYEYDIATKTFSKTPGFGNSGIGFRCKSKSLVTLDGEPCLFTYTTAGGHPRYFAMESKEYKSWDNLVLHGSGGAAIRNVTAGPDDGRLYIGVFNSDQGGIYDISQSKVTGYYKTGGQGDSQIWYEGKFYGGNYSSTTLNEVVITDYNAPRPATNEVIQRWKLDHAETGQKRVHELAAGDGYIFAGSIPDTGEYGGSVTVYDTKTGRWYTHRNVVEDCSVTGLEYYDKLLYGATSTSGGTGTTAAKTEGVSAKIFVYDYENREVVAVMDPRDHIKGLPSTVAFIGGFGQDPVVEGRFWAVVSETLFCFTYDTESKTFQVQEVISFDKSTFDSSSAKHMWSKRVLFDTERNYIYYSFDANGGFRCIELADWDAPIGSVKVASNGRIMGDAPIFYDLGEDGELYYGNQANLMMLPLNVTDEDWAIAGSVDKMITDLGEIKLESEADIKSARSAYDNLSWRYKALTQKLELLQESETDLLECKIDTIVLEEVTADSLPQLQEYVDIYNGFNARQQKYTKNYNYLLEAYGIATKLNDERVAKAMQERMDALKAKFPLTLDDEPEVLAIREDYDALTGPQRTLVDATALEDAEAQIKVLRAEFVVYVEELIQKIPAQITLDAEEVIMAAREAADKLYTNERKNVSYSKLTSAEGKLRTLKNAKAAAEEVDALIKEIGIVTLGDKDRIAEARDAYDALNGTALTFLVGGKKLERAEFILKALQTWGIPAITVANAGIVFAVIWFIPSLHNKVFKAKKKEEESIEN